MSKHLLLDKIHVYGKKHDKREGTEGAHYSDEKGYWLEDGSFTPLVNNSRRPLPSTKKADAERGEDKK